MKKMKSDEDGQILLMITIIMAFTLITVSSMSVSTSTLGAQTSSEQRQKLIMEYDNINATFWREFDSAFSEYSYIESGTVETIFNNTIKKISDLEELRGVKVSALIDPPIVDSSGTVFLGADTTVKFTLTDGRSIITATISHHTYP